MTHSIHPYSHIEVSKQIKRIAGATTDDYYIDISPVIMKLINNDIEFKKKLDELEKNSVTEITKVYITQTIIKEVPVYVEVNKVITHYVTTHCGQTLTDTEEIIKVYPKEQKIYNNVYGYGYKPKPSKDFNKGCW